RLPEWPSPDRRGRRQAPFVAAGNDLLPAVEPGLHRRAAREESRPQTADEKPGRVANGASRGRAEQLSEGRKAALLGHLLGNRRIHRVEPHHHDGSTAVGHSPVRAARALTTAKSAAWVGPSVSRSGASVM